MKNLDRGVAEGEDGDVVLLAVGLGGGGDLFSGLIADLAGAVEAKEIAGGGLGFDDAVGEQGDLIAGGELERGFGVVCIGNEAERDGGVEGDLVSVAKGREVAGAGRGK